MAFFFNRARNRTNIGDLPRQAIENLTKIEQLGKSEEQTKAEMQAKLDQLSRLEQQAKLDVQAKFEQQAKAEEQAMFDQRAIIEQQAGFEQQDGSQDGNQTQYQTRMEELNQLYKAKIDELTKLYNAKLDEATRVYKPNLDEVSRFYRPRLDESAKLIKPRTDELARVLAQIKIILQGTQEAETSPEQVYLLVSSIIDEGLLDRLAPNLFRLPFESRKDAQVIFSYVFRYRPGTASSKDLPMAVDYVVNRRPRVLIDLCRGYDHKESATQAGSVLREVLKNEAAAQIIFYDDGEEPGSSFQGISGIALNRQQSGNGIFWKFFDWIDYSSFEVAADAFTTFRELLTKHKDIVPLYLQANFDLFFGQYNTRLVKSTNYITKRQSIKLLGELLLDRSNYSVMTAYVDSGEHLKICMNLLRDERKMVQYEGFHVFKVFVANPNKSVAVQKILLMNRDRLLNFLTHFLEDRTDDEQFIDEREFLIKQIKNMPPTPVPLPR